MAVPASSVLYVVLLSFLLAEITAEEHVVKLKHGGEVRGNTLTSQKGRTIYAFRGIPYAEPPVGQLRFKKPVPKAPWNGEPIDATADGPACIQIFRREFGQEDCLFINVYTPTILELLKQLPENVHNETRMPVIVFVHGGGYFAGSSSSAQYGPGRLLDKDVVLVSMNYRLGPLGFLGTGDSASPGNYGLMDQTLALQWVKEHVEVFGGNPKEITLYGISAGAASVGFHLLSPMSSGLFHSVIAQSGTPLSWWSLQEHPMYWAKKLAADVECSTQDSSEMVECLRQIPAVQLIRLADSYSKFQTIPPTFVPTIDGEFVPKDPRQIISSGEANWVPVLSGVNKDEALVFYGNMYLFANMSDLEGTLEAAIRYILDKDGDSYETTKLIMNEFMTENNWTNKTATRINLVKFLTDFTFRMPLYETLNLLAQEDFPLYIYSLDYAPSVGLLSNFGIKDHWGVCHGDDIGLVFDGPGTELPNPTDDDEKITEKLVTAWTNFAKYNNPAPNSESNIQWERSDYGNMEVYHIDIVDSAATYQPFNDPLYKFWTKTVPQLLKQTTHSTPSDV